MSLFKATWAGLLLTPELCWVYIDTLTNSARLSANPTKRSNALKQFIGNLLTNVFDHFVGLAFKGLKLKKYNSCNIEHHKSCTTLPNFNIVILSFFYLIFVGLVCKLVQYCLIISMYAINSKYSIVQHKILCIWDISINNNLFNFRNWGTKSKTKIFIWVSLTLRNNIPLSM